MESNIIETLSEFLPQGALKEWEPMKAHTTFRIGGTARVFVKVPSDEHLSKIIKYLHMIQIPFFLMGNGSNLLVSDSVYDGVILQIGSEMSDVVFDGSEVYAQAGAMLSKVADEAQKRGLSGMEFASGIPGTIGGATVMNAGAFDGEMKDIVYEVTVMDYVGNVLCLDNDTMSFKYRDSVVRNKNFVLTGVKLKLREGDPTAIKEKMQDFAKRRLQKQPLEYPSAGSVFKRPENNFAGKLIMDAGLRGYRIGEAQVSEKHCGFIVNIGNASAQDVSDLICEIQSRVKERFGVTLETEIIRVGNF